MKIGILKSGQLHPDIVAKHGTYPEQYMRLLRRADPDLEFFAVHVDEGEPLPDIHDADGWLIPGSKHGAYDDLPWIEPMKDFLRRAVAAGIPVVGICFGHQMLAEALGGKVVKSDKGWGLGIDDYTPVHTPSWMAQLAKPWSGHVVHQDQIVELPPEAVVLAASPFCEYAALAYGDPEHPKALSVQAHPEFSADFMNDLIEVRMKDVAPPELVARGRQRLGERVAAQEWAEAIVRYFRNANAGAIAPA